MPNGRHIVPFTVALIFALLGAAAPARAADPPIDFGEQIFGATNTHAVAGEGGLTAGISNDGDLTVLSWPSPGVEDQLAYFTSNAPDARQLPHRGAADGMGSFVGLVVDTASGRKVTWLRDPAWTHTQGYSQPDAPVPVTRFKDAALGLTVTVTDVVSPQVSVLTRRVRVERAPDSPVTGVSLLAYENLAPSVSVVPQLPVGDWAIDTINDFGAVWDARSHAILHFHPADRSAVNQFLGLAGLDADVDYGPLEALMQQQQPTAKAVSAFVAGIDTSYSAGVAALVTTEPAPAEFQVGSASTPLCGLMDKLLDNVLAVPTRYPSVKIPIDTSTANALRCHDPLPRLRQNHGWLWQPQDARLDAADGALSGSLVAAGRTNGALLTPLTFNGGVAEGDMEFAFGHTVAEARAALATAQQRTPAERQSAAEQAAAAAIDGLALPDPSLGKRVVDVARRALVNLYVARDRHTGAMIASVSRQPPYALDWPRDGAFFSAGLDVAGRHDWVTQRMEWYAGLIRNTFTAGIPLLTPEVPTDPDSGRKLFPRHVWEMNYYTDGTIGGPIRFEIDNTAMHVWAVVVHAAYLDGDARRAFVDQVWPSTRDALDVLERWRDPNTGLPAPANEDDHLQLTSSLLGAVAVHAAMIAGARLAHYVGDEDRAHGYLDSANELADAIVKTYYDPAVGLFREVQGGTAGPHGGDTAWLVWPGRVLPKGDPRIEAQLEADMTAVLATLRGQGTRGGGSYDAKTVLAAALYGADDGARKMARQAVELLANVADPETDQFGEVYVRRPDGTWSNRVAAPHVWEGMLFYMSAMALSDPGRFNREEQALPLPPTASGSWGCRVAAGAGAGAGGGGGALAAALAALAAAFALRRRRQGAVRRAAPRG